MLDKINQIKTSFFDVLEKADNPASLEEVRIQYLSRNGLVAQLFDALKAIPTEEKPRIGKELNALRTEVQTAFDARKALLNKAATTDQLPLDLTLPGRARPVGTKHPIAQTLESIKRIFTGMGFSVALGPEMESDYYNFEALNFPPDHPARDMQDTIFISQQVLLRTHTSPVQIRVMENQQPPVRIIAPGKVYRNEAVSARSLVQFHQVEGLYVDRGVTLSELKGTLVAFARQFFGSSIKYRFRPSFFPFTEPSAEMDITCFICNGKGCRVCKQLGWLEILGSGMIHPHIFQAVGYDPEIYSGYAFGMGIERTALLLYGLDDIRLFYENDLRFLRQF